jgi:hypothetical protein
VDSAVHKVAVKVGDKVADKVGDKVADKIGDKVGDKVGDELSAPAAPRMMDRLKFATFIAPPQAGYLEGSELVFVRPVHHLDTAAAAEDYQRQRALVSSAARKSVAEQLRQAEQNLLNAGVSESDARSWAGTARAAAQASVDSRLQAADAARLRRKPMLTADRALLLTSDGPAQLAQQALRAIATPN